MTITPATVRIAAARTWRCDACDVAWKEPASVTGHCWHCGRLGYPGVPVHVDSRPYRHDPPRDIELPPLADIPVTPRPRWM